MNRFFENIYYQASEFWHNIKLFVRSCIRIWKYRKVVGYGYDWDYGYLLNMVRYQLSRMQTYTSAHCVHMDFETDASRMQTAIRLLDIISETDPSYVRRDIPDISRDVYWLENPCYINTKNATRFIPKFDSLYNHNPSNESIVFLRASLRIEKAWKLFFAFCEHNMRDWWD